MATDNSNSISSNPEILEGLSSFIDKEDPKFKKLGSHLLTLQQEYESYVNQNNELPFQSSNPLFSIVIEDHLLLVDAVAADDAETLLADLENLGIRNASSFGSIVSGLLPIESIEELASLDSLKFAQPAAAITNVGSTTSQGDPAMDADHARSVFGVDGSGVTVGVLSDSYDYLGGASADVASGDLPGVGNPLGNTTSVNVLQDFANPRNIDEGRAMLQLVHDVAPGADLAFHTAFTGQAGFANGIIDLANVAGSDVIVDDVIYFAEPMFQDGIIAQAVDTVVANEVPYFSSAGNNGRNAYESAFNPSGLFLFGSDELHDFNPGAGVDVLQSITVPTGAEFIISFQWDSPFFSVSGGAGSPNDLDIWLLDSTATTILAGSNLSNTGNDPVEVFSFQNNGTFGTNQFNIAISNSNGPDPNLMKYVMFEGGGNTTINQFDTASPTLYGHANANGAEAVGAAFYQQTPRFGTNPPVIEPFSSPGPTPILFETDGTPTFELRDKPEIVAPDGTDTTFFGFDVDGNTFPNFFGTSAAAPHAAAVAALLLEKYPGMPPGVPAQIYDVLERTAIDMDDPSTPGFDVRFDYATGYGLIDAHEAAKTWGDPHLVTFDGLSYDFQGTGDFILMESEGVDANNPDDDFTVHVRQEPWFQNNNVTVNTGAAIKVNGYSVVLYAEPQLQNSIFDLNNPSAAPITLQPGQSFQLGNDAAVTRTGNSFEISSTWEKVSVDYHEVQDYGYFNIDLDRFMGLPMTGLLGNSNGNPNDDITLRDGTVVPQNQRTFDFLNTTFAESWQVSQEESLFENPIELAAPEQEITIDTLNPELRETAIAIVEESGIKIPEVFVDDVALDVALTLEGLGFEPGNKDPELEQIAGQVVTNLEGFFDDFDTTSIVSLDDIKDEGISGTKWNDLDGDGVRDAEEPGLEGWTIYLDQNENRQLDKGEVSTITDANGKYNFTGIKPNVYHIAEVMQEGWKQTYPNEEHHVVGYEGVEITDIDFGNRQCIGCDDEPNDTIPQAIAGLNGLNGPGTFFDKGFIGDNPNIDPSDDVDLIELQLEAGQQVTIDIDSRDYGSALDSALRLFDSAGNELAFSDDNAAPGESYTRDSYIDFTASATDTYYVGVSSYCDFYYDPFIEGSGKGYTTGEYNIEISILEPNNTNTTTPVSPILTPAETISNLTGASAIPTLSMGAANDLLDISIDGVTQDKEILSYGGANQNKGISSTVNGTELTLVGNGWRKVDITGYEITEDTILNFEFKAQNLGEIQGIGFDNNDVIGNDDTARFFQVAGTQDWGIDNLNQYIQGSSNGFTEYSIPVGDFFAGEFDFLTFGNDHDVANPNAMVEFRNIQLVA